MGLMETDDGEKQVNSSDIKCAQKRGGQPTEAGSGLAQEAFHSQEQGQSHPECRLRAKGKWSYCLGTKAINSFFSLLPFQGKLSSSYI